MKALCFFWGGFTRVFLVQKKTWIAKDTCTRTYNRFWEWSSLSESEGTEHLPEDLPLQLEKSTGGETMSLEDKTLCFAYFNDVSG